MVTLGPPTIDASREQSRDSAMEAKADRKLCPALRRATWRTITSDRGDYPTVELNEILTPAPMTYRDRECGGTGRPAGPTSGIEEGRREEK